MLAKGKQFLLLIRHPPCCSHIQSSPVKVSVIEERKHLRKKSKIHTIKGKYILIIKALDIDLHYNCVNYYLYLLLKLYYKINNWCYS